jgi:hypothetical protein
MQRVSWRNLVRFLNPRVVPLVVAMAIMLTGLSSSIVSAQDAVPAVEGTTSDAPAMPNSLTPVDGDNGTMWADYYSVTKDDSLVVAAPGVLANDMWPSYCTGIPVFGAPAHGDLIPGAAPGSFSYYPFTGYAGPDEFIYKIDCKFSFGWPIPSFTKTYISHVFINVLTPPPCAVDDAYIAPANILLSIPARGLLANDGRGVGTPHLISIDSSPRHGSVSANPDGSFIYMPDLGYSGRDTFVYFAKCYSIEGAVVSGTATVTIDLAASPISTPAPTSTPILIPCTASDDAYTTATDAVLDVAAPGVLSNDLGTSPSVSYVGSSPAHGSISQNSDGSLTYTPDAGYVGTDSYTYVIGCADGGDATATVTITVTESCAVNDDFYTVPFNTTLIVDDPGLFTNDTIGDRLLQDRPVDGSHGTASVGSLGGFEYTPNTGFSGTDSFKYTINCGGPGATRIVTATVHLTVLPLGGMTPTATAVPMSCTATDDTYTTGMDAVLTVAAPGVLGNDMGTDPSVSYVGTSPIHGTVTQAADGSFTYTQDAGYVGIDSYTYVIGCTDGSDAVGTVTVDVTAPSVPDATPLP